MTKRYLTIPVVVAGLGLGAANVLATEPQQPASNEAMQQKLEQLQAEIQQLKTQQVQQAQQQQAANAQVVDQTVERVLQDSQKRSQLMQMEGFTAGWNNDRFTIGSADGAFTLQPYFMMQFRYTANYETGDNDNSQMGFSLPRVKMGVDGTAMSKSFDYFFRWNSGDSDGGGTGPLNLEQAWGRYQYSDQLGFRAGQFVALFSHEQNVTSDRQLAADRSLMNQILTGADESYEQGVSVIFSWNEAIHTEIAFTDGINTGNTNFQQFPDGPTNFGFGSRTEWSVMGGKSGEYADFTAMGNKEDLLVVGFGSDFTQAGDTNNMMFTLDCQWEGTQGLSIYGAGMVEAIKNGTGAGITGVTASTDEDTTNWGVLIQVGYMLNPEWEIFGRYDYTTLDDEIAVGTPPNTDTSDSFQELTGGVNWYFRKHNAKVTVDVSWIPDGSPTGLSNLGILDSNDDEWVVRAQFQLML